MKYSYRKIFGILLIILGVLGCWFLGELNAVYLFMVFCGFYAFLEGKKMEVYQGKNREI